MHFVLATLAYFGVPLLPSLGNTLALRIFMTLQEQAFELWKDRLWEDCERNDKSLAYSRLGEVCLKILWESGTEPSVQGIVDGGKQTP